MQNLSNEYFHFFFYRFSWPLHDRSLSKPTIGDAIELRLLLYFAVALCYLALLWVMFNKAVLPAGMFGDGVHREEGLVAGAPSQK